MPQHVISLDDALAFSVMPQAALLIARYRIADRSITDGQEYGEPEFCYQQPDMLSVFTSTVLHG